MTRARQSIGPNAEAILATIAETRAGWDGIVRVILPHRFFWVIVEEQGIGDVFGEQWDLMNAQTAAAAAQHGFPVVDLGIVLMGPDRDRDPVAAGYSDDTIHLTDKGTDAAIAALMELGVSDAPDVDR